MLSGQLLKSKASHQPTITKGDPRHRCSTRILPGNAICKVQETAGSYADHLLNATYNQSPMMLVSNNQIQFSKGKVKSHQLNTWKPAYLHLLPILVISVLKDEGQERIAELQSTQLSPEHTKSLGLGTMKMAQYIKCLPSTDPKNPRKPRQVCSQLYSQHSRGRERGSPGQAGQL